MFSFLRLMAVKRKPSVKTGRRLNVSLGIERLEDRLAPALPTVSSVNSTDSAGTYGVGATIPIDVNFTGAVTVTGTPTLQLATGTVNYSSGSGSATLVFNYLVTAGQSTGGADLNYVSTGSLLGTITDANNNLPGTGGIKSLANSGIVIDTVAPTVTNITSTLANATYGLGTAIDVEITFSKIVNVTGTPQLALSSGGTANYTSGTGTKKLTFTYTVGAGDTTSGSGLDAASTGALTLNGGTIGDTDINPNPAILTVSVNPTAGSLGANKTIKIDAVAPIVTNIASTLGNGTYGAGAAIDVEITFSKVVNVTGTPQLALNSGGTANYTSGTGSKILTFTYTVVAGNTSSGGRLDAASTSALALNGGTIDDTLVHNPNPANLAVAVSPTTGSLAVNNNIKIDAVAPTVTNIASTLANGTYGTGAVIDVEITFSKVVNVTGTPQLALNFRGTANYTSGTGSKILTFTYTVGAGDTTSGGILDAASTGALTLNSGTIDDTIVNDPNLATLTVPVSPAAGALAVNNTIKIDAVAPTVTNITSTLGNGVYGVGASIDVEVIFSKPVVVSGTPKLALNNSGAKASYTSGSGSSTLTFTYTVAAGDSTGGLDLDAASASALTGTIKDTVANDPNPAILTVPISTAGNSLGVNKAIIIDAVAPTVLSVSSTNAAGSYGAGATITIAVNFSKAVNVTGGTPTLALKTGTGGKAFYASGSGTSALLFTYTVLAGDSDPDLNYTSINALALNGATIQDTVTNNPNTALLTLPALTSANALAPSLIDVDALAPTVLSVSSTTAAGSYGAGAAINVTITFSKAVNATGTPKLNLNSGGKAFYSSGTGSNILTFVYTVAAGDSNADLNSNSTGALVLNGGTIEDTITNNPNAAGLTLPALTSANELAPSLIDVDAVAPTVLSVSSTNAAGSYGAGATITIAVNFSKAVNVTGGTPTLALKTGTGGMAYYASGTGSSTLLFTYTVLAGDSDPDLNYTSTTALALNGATIQDTVTNNPNIALLTLPSLTSSKSLAPSLIDIDAVAPTVTSVSSTNAAGSYGAGATITIAVNFSKAVKVDVTGGTPKLNLDSGGTAFYASSTGTSTLMFTYTVAAGDSSADLNYTGPGALKLSGGTILDTVTTDPNVAVLTLPGTGSPKSLAPSLIDVDAVAPTVLSVSSTNAAGSYGAGATITIAVSFSNAVNVNVTGGTPTLALKTGTGGMASYASGTGSSTLLFTYTVLAGDSNPDLNYMSINALALNGATIQDTVTTDPNTAVLTLPALTSANALAPSLIDIDAVAPTVTNITSTTANSTYGTGATINVNITFSKVVNVTGTPLLALNSGGTANYTSGSGTNKLTFTYTVGAGQNSADLDAASSAALTGTITDTVANNPNTANLTVPVSPANNALGVRKSIVVDAVAPTVTSVSSTNAASSYGAGATIDVTVNFSKAVNVTGTPLLALNSGVNVDASYASGSGTGTLTFTYTVAAGQSSADLNYTGIGALTLNGGTIQDTVPNNPNTAVLTLPALTSANSLAASNIVIDAVAPVVIGVASTNSAGSYGAGANINVTVSFSKKVNVTGTPLLALNSGVSVNASYASGSGTSTLTFTYTVAAGQSNADLDCTGTGSLTLNGGTIQDTVANNPNTAVLTLPAPGAANSLAASHIVIDAIAPTVTNITSSALNGSYGVGLSISITIAFSKVVKVTGAPQLALNSGGTASYTSGSGTNTLTFTYTVGAGQGSTDLDAASTAALTLNGGTINDTVTHNPNPANLTVPVAPAAGALGVNKSIVIDTVAPTVLHYYVLFGIEKYDLIGSTRLDLPWQITGIEVVFTKAITSGDIHSLTGVLNTSFTGLGTNTLTWKFNAIANGAFPTLLMGTGADALKDVAGNKLNAGAGFAQSFKVVIDDVNGDGVVNTADLLAVTASLGKYNIFEDVNGDGSVTQADVLAVFNKLTGH